MKIFGLFLALFFLNQASGQTLREQDFLRLQKAFAEPPKARLGERFSLSRQNSNEAQWVLSGLFLAYKACISSQDGQRCAFHPTCSEYGLQAVKKMGILRGVISAFDRLSRCNGFRKTQYDPAPDRQHWLDPIRW